MVSFVAGAPAMLLSNAAGQPTKRLANGSPAFFHSLTFADETPSDYEEALAVGTRGHLRRLLERVQSRKLMRTRRRTRLRAGCEYRLSRLRFSVA